jgi:hypothetical protein
MPLFNSDTIKLLKSKKVCCYPSSGADIASINFWRNGFGNQTIPDVFIFTDCAFIMNENLLSIIENTNMIDTLKNFGFNKTHYEEIEDVENFRQVLINNEELLNKLDLSLIKNYLKGEQRELLNSLFDLNEIGVIENYVIIENQELLDIFNNHFNEIFNKNLDLIQNDSELLIFLRNQKLSFKNEQLNTELIFIKTKNESFYNFCINENIKIPCFQLKRHMDQKLFTGFDLTTLKVKEAIVRNQDLCCLSNVYTEINNFTWSTHYCDDTAKLIRIY